MTTLAPFPRPLVIAHRGASGDRPENTFPAFALAVEQGADMIETDLHRTRDGVIVIHHDAELARLGRAGEIGDYTAAELSVLNAAPGEAVVEPIPTLPELLDRFGERIEWNLEIKVGTREAYAGIERAALREVASRSLLSRMLFSSFDDGVLERVRAESEAARVAVLVSPRAPRRILERAAAVRAEAIHPHVSLVDERLVREAHDAGLRVYPYTANSRRDMLRLLACRVDGLITNHPDRLLGLVSESQMGPASA
ncbi:MAG: glycerophosphodiester phosphodiesterase [Spirochaetaceae bacterium]|nr:glycerophosphodiester phosphodiesterase [Myxococcales bacterium]MCB9723527.1 glycerophosphodiester phosphodiesterase [Spirochaetaceae bacterium]